MIIIALQLNTGRKERLQELLVPLCKNEAKRIQAFRGDSGRIYE